MSMADAPLAHAESAEPRRVEQRFGLGDPTAHLEGGQVGARRRSVPGRPTLFDQFADAPTLQELRLRAHGVGGGQLVETDLGGDVLAPGMDEVVAATLVALVRA